jgi:hypothetical protein
VRARVRENGGIMGFSPDYFARNGEWVLEDVLCFSNTVNRPFVSFVLESHREIFRVIE